MLKRDCKEYLKMESSF